MAVTVEGAEGGRKEEDPTVFLKVIKLHSERRENGLLKF
jgi:hypothetical protein